MRVIWLLPDQDSLVSRNTGKDWLLNVLANCSEEVRDRTIMLIYIWRIWALRSDLVREKDVPSPTVSADYLQSYMRSLNLSWRYSTEDFTKGKMLTMEEGPAIPVRVVHAALS